MHLRPTPARTTHGDTTLVAVPERQPARRSTLSSAPADVAYSAQKIVQCGLYAMEMLCGSYDASHFITLFIIGMLTVLCSVTQMFICYRCEPMDSVR
jgi:hypothetical protein